MMFKHVCEEQPSHLFGCDSFLGGNEVCYLVKMIHHHHDGIKSP